MERDFIQKFTYDINNGGTLELVQRGHDGTVLICKKPWRWYREHTTQEAVEILRIEAI